MSTIGLYQRTCSSPELTREGCKLILSIDDDPSVLDTRFKLFSAAGYAVLSTTDGANALQLFGRYPVDLVVLNYMLPHIDGALLAQAMKGYEPSVPVIMISPLQVPDEALVNVNQFLLDGHEPEALLNAIRELLASSVRIRPRPGA